MALSAVCYETDPVMLKNIPGKKVIVLYIIPEISKTEAYNEKH